jgi:TolB protein
MFHTLQKRSVALLLLSGIAATLFWQAAILRTHAQTPPQLVVQAYPLNVRSGPGLGFPVIDALRANASATLIGRNAESGWWQIRLENGASGWVTNAPDLVTTDEDASSVPLVASPVLPAPVSAQASAATGMLAFQTSSGSDIWVVKADGTGLRKLTTGIDPAISPDGQRVAFTRWDDSQVGAKGSVWAINIDGSKETRLHDASQPKAPTWGPDGQLVINLQQGGWLEARRVCGSGAPADAQFVEEVDDGKGNKRICYLAAPDPWWGLRLIKSDGTYVDLQHDAHSFSPTWNPALPWQVVYAGTKGLMSEDVNRNATWALTEDISDRSPVFSPDGSRLALAYRAIDHWEIHLLNSADLTRTRLQADATSAASEKPSALWNDTAPAWSPDGKKLAFLTDRTGRWELWTMNVDGSQQRSLLPSSAYSYIKFRYDNMDERMVSWR